MRHEGLIAELATILDKLLLWGNLQKPGSHRVLLPWLALVLELS